MHLNLMLSVRVPESLHQAALAQAKTDNLERALELLVSERVQTIIDAEAADAVQPRATKSSKKKPAARR